MNVFRERNVGYALLRERYQLKLPSCRHESLLASHRGERRLRNEGMRQNEAFSSKYDPGEHDFDQLVFALKYDGVDLATLKHVFLHTDVAEFAHRIRESPSSQFARRLFFFFELLTGTRLPIDDIQGVRYVEALEPERYYVAEGTRRPRYRVIDNLLGSASFCPIVRRTEALRAYEELDLSERAMRITQSADPSLLARAVTHLYGKETRSTFAIEHEDPGDRTDRFIAQLERIGRRELHEEADFVELQNAIVMPPYCEAHFRQDEDPEVYVGETIGFRERIHHVGARTQITRELMRGLCDVKAVTGPSGAVIEAGARSFAFVFIHPFGDGNGRIHRLILHHVLAKRAFLPDHLVVPISSVIQRKAHEYDQVLEDFSKQVMPLVKYRLSETGELTILEAPDDAYRFMDLTPQCEATFRWLKIALEEDLEDELAFLRSYDEIKARIRDVVEMPDKKERLFIKLCLQNQGKLSNAKRALFAELSDETIERMERVVLEYMPKRTT